MGLADDLRKMTDKAVENSKTREKKILERLSTGKGFNQIYNSLTDKLIHDANEGRSDFYLTQGKIKGLAEPQLVGDEVYFMVGVDYTPVKVALMNALSEDGFSVKVDDEGGLTIRW